MSKVQLFQIIKSLISLYELILFVRIIMSYLDVDYYHPIVRFIYNLTDPVMDLVRRYIPCQFGMMDFSPIVIIFLLYVFQRALVTLLFGL